MKSAGFRDGGAVRGNGNKNGVTLADVAAAAGVSVSAVSKVVLGGGGQTTKVGAAAAARIRAVAARLNYRPNSAARQLKTGKSRIIGAIIHAQAARVNYDRFSIIQRKLAPMGYAFMVGETDGSVEMIGRYLEKFCSWNVDVIISACHDVPGAAPRVRRLYAGARNVLFMGRPSFPARAFVEPDTRDGILQVMAHLAGRGVRRIALDVMNQGYRTVKMRVAGYRDGLRRHGLPFDSRLMLDYQGDFLDLSATARRAAALRAQAVVASNDQRAIMLIKELRELGLQVPGDMLVTGFDNMDFSGYCQPALTTVDPGNEQIALRAAEMIATFLECKSFPASAVLPTRLVVRESA